MIMKRIFSCSPLCVSLVFILGNQTNVHHHLPTKYRYLLSPLGHMEKYLTEEEEP